MPTAVTLSTIQAARDRIQDGLYLSPCPESIPLSDLCGFHVYCKLEYLQRTGSFKERGARNALLCLSEEEAAKGVVAASAGNHALGLAYHGGLLNIPVTVVMPQFAPIIKITSCRRLGAEVILHGSALQEAQEKALEIARERGKVFVHPYNDANVIAGQGTIGLEILEQVPDMEAIVVPVGGGGLISGIATAVKALRPEVEIIGVEPASAPSLTTAFAHGGSARCEVGSTLADGLAVSAIGELVFETASEKVNRVELVSEKAIALAVLRLAELEKSIVEGAGAAPLAAALDGKLDGLRGKKVVFILSGGNIDLNILSRIIERGLVADGRLTRFTAVMKERPGSLAAFAQIVASTGASIRDVTHDRTFAGPDVSAVNVLCVVETRDADHIRELYAKLRDSGIELLPHD